MNERTKSYISDFARRSFRDVADRDYVAARACHRLGLEQQFLWMALQSAEKYIKGILLFNLRSTKGYGHNVKRAFDALSQINDFSFRFPSEIGDFLEYLEKQAVDRYFTRPYYTRGGELLMLDRVVWHLRLYCQPLNCGTFASNGKQIDYLALKLQQIDHAIASKKPTRFVLFGGHLENLICGKDNEARRALVWKNFYFGKRARTQLRNVTFRSRSEVPTHVLHPEVIAELDRLVQL